MIALNENNGEKKHFQRWKYSKQNNGNKKQQQKKSEERKNDEKIKLKKRKVDQIIILIAIATAMFNAMYCF